MGKSLAYESWLQGLALFLGGPSSTEETRYQTAPIQTNVNCLPHIAIRHFACPMSDVAGIDISLLMILVENKPI